MSNEIKHINGLRFFSVLIVFLNHLGISGFQNGFIGVDIFFVISGFFLYPLLNNATQNTQTLKLFLIKRIKRLFPNLFLILILIYIFSLIILPTHLNEKIITNYYSALFSIFNYNLILSGSDYFGYSSKYNPFLHLWSISVEIQFYLIFLIFFLFFFKKNQYYLIASIFLISLLSIFLSIDLSKVKHFYYLTFIRIFEFSLGLLLFNYSNYIVELKKDNSLSFFGMGLIIFTLFLINENFLIPGYIVIVPIIGASLLIVTAKSFIAKILSLELFNYFGKLSFLIYLVHWPIILFLKFLITNNVLILVISIILSFGLSFMIYRFYEKPIRFSKNGAIILLLFFLTIIIPIFIPKNLNNSKENNFKLLNLQKKERVNYLTYKNIEFLNNDKNIIIIGDSHADDLFLGLKKIYNSKDFIFSRVKVDTICYNLNNKRPLISIFFKKNGTCENQIENLTKILDEKNKISKIILVNHWKESNIEYLDDIYKLLIKINIPILILNQNTTFKDIQHIIYRTKNLDNLNDQLYEKKIDNSLINKKIKEITFKNVFFEYFDRDILFCNHDKLICNFYDKENKVFNYIDGSHISIFASRKLAQTVLNLLNE